MMLTMANRKWLRSPRVLFLALAGLFFIFSLAYFFLPRVFHLQINEKLGRLHFWTNAIAFLLLLAFPVYFNLSFHSSSSESRLGRFLGRSGRHWIHLRGELG